MAKHLDIHNHSTRRKLNLHVQHCNTVPFKKNSQPYIGDPMDPDTVKLVKGGTAWDRKYFPHWTNFRIIQNK
jgi:hypothetical protein